MNDLTYMVPSIQDPIEERSAQLQEDLQILKEYLVMCVNKEDWHGVMDASVDIREVVAKLSILDRIEVRGNLTMQ